MPKRVLALTRTGVAGRVYGDMRHAIVTGRLPGGSRLKEIDMAVQFGASRTPIRQALLQLQSEGLVVLYANRGAIVRTLDEKDVEDAFQLRALLEGYGAGLAAQRLGADDIATLRRMCLEMEQHDAVTISQAAIYDLLTRNDAFHRIILDASGNRRLTPVLRATMEIPHVYRTYYWYALDERKRSFQYHREIVEAIRARDSVWAESTMKSHLHAARDYLVARLRSERAASKPDAPAAS